MQKCFSALDGMSLIAEIKKMALSKDFPDLVRTSPVIVIAQNGDFSVLCLQLTEGNDQSRRKRCNRAMSHEVARNGNHIWLLGVDQLNDSQQSFGRQACSHMNVTELYQP